jgi:hypothetical protein
MDNGIADTAVYVADGHRRRSLGATGEAGTRWTPASCGRGV